MSNVHDQEVKSVENHVNTITKCDYNVGKNIRVHCCKNITPKHGQNTSKISVANKNINIARGKVTSDTKNHYSRAKVIEKPQITMQNTQTQIMVKRANQRIIAMHLTMTLYRGVILQRIDKVALQTT